MLAGLVGEPVAAVVAAAAGLAALVDAAAVFAEFVVGWENDQSHWLSNALNTC